MKNLGLIILSSLTFIAHNAVAGVHAKNLWRHNEVTVCFAKGENKERKIFNRPVNIENWTDKNKKKAQKWISGDYRPERTGIHFTGWKSCEEMQEADIILYYSNNEKFMLAPEGQIGGFANVGPLKSPLAGSHRALGYVIMNSNGFYKSTIIHEFGHVAGLAHEHNHPNATKSALCNVIKPQLFDEYEYEPYDSKSVMHYCSNANKLSPKDVALLRKIYP
jgi:hypothetical protein